MTRLTICLCLFCLSAVVLMGCTRLRVLSTSPTVPEALKEECPLLEPPEDDSFSAIFEAYIGTIKLYGVCRVRHKALIESL